MGELLEHVIRVTLKMLKVAEEYFAKDKNEWGLGQTYFLMGRAHFAKRVTFENFQSA